MPLHDGHGGEVDAICHITHRENTRDVGLRKLIHLITHATMLQRHNVNHTHANSKIWSWVFNVCPYFGVESLWCYIIGFLFVVILLCCRYVIDRIMLSWSSNRIIIWLRH